MRSVLEIINHLSANEPVNPVRTVKFSKGEIILHSYQDTDYLHVVRSGLIKVYGINDKGEEKVAVIYGKEDVFPLSWVMLNRHKNAYFQAISDSEISLISKDFFMTTMKTNADLAFAMSCRILEQFELYASRVNNLEFKYGHERLIYRLLLLADRFGKNVNDTVEIPRVNQSDLAAMINVSREYLSREMSKLEQRELIKYRKDIILILKPDILYKKLGDDVSALFFNPQHIKRK